MMVPSADTFKAKNSQPLVFGKAARSCFTIASVGISCRTVPVGYSLSGTLSVNIRMASLSSGIGILNPRVSHFRQVEETAKAPFGYRKIISRKCYGQIETQNESCDAPHYFSVAAPQRGSGKPDESDPSFGEGQRKAPIIGHIRRNIVRMRPPIANER